MPSESIKKRINKSNETKILLFFLWTSFAIANIWSIIISNDIMSYSGNWLSHNTSALFFGLCTGPVSSFFMLHKRGAYKAALTLLCQTLAALIFIGLYKSTDLIFTLGCLYAGQILTGLLTLAPVITHYLKGPLPLALIFPKVICCCFAGLIFANPFAIFSQDSVNIMFFTFLLIFGGFFTVFSAWKTRLVLLK